MHEISPVSTFIFWILIKRHDTSHLRRRSIKSVHVNEKLVRNMFYVAGINKSFFSHSHLGVENVDGMLRAVEGATRADSCVLSRVCVCVCVCCVRVMREVAVPFALPICI